MRALLHPSGLPHESATSKSSKSSSLTTSNTDAGLTDLSHFEDIGLDDDHANYIKNRSLGSPSTPANSGSARRSSSLVSSARELTSSARAGSSLAIETGRDVRSTSSASLALPNGSKRGRIAPSLGIVTTGQRNASRSPSPTHMNQRPVSPARMKRLPSNGPAQGSSAPFTLPRRPSGQRQRKTAKEIEAEYHDSDEDLPEDASLWNVPLSPSLFRTASSAANSANVSASTSPERPSYLRASPTHGHLRSAKTMPMPAKPFPPRSDSVHSSPVGPRPPQTRASTGSLDMFTFGKTRSKSWSNVLSELSEDVMALSEALDAYTHESGDANGLWGADKVTDTRRVKSSIVELPPLRKNNVMIDPLPISKEKEKVLSRTRPSWLPPKDQKEEQRHLKEYKRMMEASMEAEKKRASKAATEKCARDDTAAILQRIWDEHMLPNWSEAIREPRARELWWRGIPQRARPEVWKRAITNELGLTPNTYSKALERARAVEVQSGQPAGKEQPRESVWLQAIHRDVRHTLPALHLFQAGQPLHESLIDLLCAYAMYRADVGYVYGTHLISALLLLTLSSVNEAFIALANYLNRPLPLAFLIGDKSGTTRTYELILNLLRSKRPRLHERLFESAKDGNLELRPEEVFEPMIRTLFLNGCCDADDPAVPPTPMTAAAVKSTFPSFQFTLPTPRSPSIPISPRTPSMPGFNFRGVTTSSSQGLSLPLVQRLWDVIVFDGDAAIIRACVGILAAKESALYGSKESVMQILGWNGALRLGEDSGGFSGYTSSNNNNNNNNGGNVVNDAQEEEAEAVERVMALVRSIGKEDKRTTNGEQKSSNKRNNSLGTPITSPT